MGCFTLDLVAFVCRRQCRKGLIVRIGKLALLRSRFVEFMGSIRLSVLPFLFCKTPLLAAGKKSCTQVELYVDTLPVTMEYLTVGCTKCVSICGILGLRDTISNAIDKSAVDVVRMFFQPIPDVARMEVNTVTKVRLHNDKANGNGKVRLECAAAMQFMRSLRWDTLIDVCLDEGGITNKRPGRRLWGDVGRDWCKTFARTCIYAWEN